MLVERKVRKGKVILCQVVRKDLTTAAAVSAEQRPWEHREKLGRCLQEELPSIRSKKETRAQVGAALPTQDW